MRLGKPDLRALCKGVLVVIANAMSAVLQIGCDVHESEPLIGDAQLYMVEGAGHGFYGAVQGQIIGEAVSFMSVISCTRQARCEGVVE